MNTWFASLAGEIREALSAFLSIQQNIFQETAPHLGEDALLRLEAYAGRGKIMRGSLVFLGYELASGKEIGESEKKSLLYLAICMELLQSALLIHDDIMDRDLLRRGEPSMHASYASFLHKKDQSDADHRGEALAICLGDIAIFLAWQAFGQINLPHSVKNDLSVLVSRELSRVGLAQMLDILEGEASFFASGEREGDLNEEDIIEKVYRYKTGRYSFSLPLLVGASVASASQSVLKALERAGEELGIAFQIKDDELGLWGQEEKLGKALGSDISGNKRTFYRFELFRSLSERAKTGDKEALRILDFFGSSELSARDFQMVIASMEREGVRERIGERIQNHANRAKELLAPILKKASARSRAEIEKFFTWNLERES